MPKKLPDFSDLKHCTFIPFSKDPSAFTFPNSSLFKDYSICIFVEISPLLTFFLFFLYSLQGLTRPADLFVVVEVDSYGHFFRKCKTQLVLNTMEPKWDEQFIIELEGSENLRILVYEQTSQVRNSFSILHS